MLSFLGHTAAVFNIVYAMFAVARLLHERHARGDDKAVTLDLHS